MQIADGYKRLQKRQVLVLVAAFVAVTVVVCCATTVTATATAASQATNFFWPFATEPPPPTTTTTTKTTTLPTQTLPTHKPSAVDQSNNDADDNDNDNAATSARGSSAAHSDIALSNVVVNAVAQADSFAELSARLALMETQVARVASKLAEKRDGESWRHKCDVCKCHRGQVKCTRAPCPNVQCAQPQYLAGKCCPQCFKDCVFGGHRLRHAREFIVKTAAHTCTKCVCYDGRLKCGSQNASNVTLNASLSVQRAPPTLDEIQHQSRTQRAQTQHNHRGDSPPSPPIDLRQFSQRNVGSEFLNAAAAAGDDDDAFTGQRRYNSSQRLFAGDVVSLRQAVDATMVRADLANGDADDSRLARREALSSASASASTTTTASKTETSKKHSVCPELGCSQSQSFSLIDDCCPQCAQVNFCAEFKCVANARCVRLWPRKWLYKRQHYQQKAANNNKSAESGDSSRGDSSIQQDDNDDDADEDLNLIADSNLNLNLNLNIVELVARFVDADGVLTVPSGRLAAKQDLYKCKCLPGFEPVVIDGKLLSCVDIDECGVNVNASNACQLNDPNSMCKNTLGSFECRCKAGYWRPPSSSLYQHQHQHRLQKTTNSKCVDIDECSAPNLNNCHPQAVCNNTDGAYKCTCKAGLLGSGTECAPWPLSAHSAHYEHRHMAPVNAAGAGDGGEPLAAARESSQEAAEEREVARLAAAGDTSEQSTTTEQQQPDSTTTSNASAETAAADDDNADVNDGDSTAETTTTTTTEATTITPAATTATTTTASTTATTTAAPVSGGPNTRTMFFQLPPSDRSQGPDFGLAAFEPRATTADHQQQRQLQSQTRPQSQQHQPLNVTLKPARGAGYRRGSIIVEATSDELAMGSRRLKQTAAAASSSAASASASSMSTASRLASLSRSSNSQIAFYLFLLLHEPAICAHFVTSIILVALVARLTTSRPAVAASALGVAASSGAKLDHTRQASQPPAH